jgi:riboflavin synthase
MFTGIITDIGHVRSLEHRGDLHARIATGYDTSSGIDIGASIACNGVCLTVTETGGDWFEVSISAETLSKIRRWAAGPRARALNLERALKVGDELGGHIVSGHVDGVAEIVATRDEGESTRFTFRAPGALARFIAPKGSVALDGTSLTVNEVEGAEFGVNIIPHTKEVTTWGASEGGRPGEPRGRHDGPLRGAVAGLAGGLSRFPRCRADAFGGRISGKMKGDRRLAKPVVLRSIEDAGRRSLRGYPVRRGQRYFWVECRRDPEDSHGWRHVGVRSAGFGTEPRRWRRHGPRLVGWRTHERHRA